MTSDVQIPPRSGPCPDPEQLAAFIDGGLSAAERRTIETHLGDCADCRDIIGDTVAFQSQTAKVVPFRRPWLIYPLGTALLAAAAALVLVVRMDRSVPEMADLVTAVGTARPIEARLSGGFAYGNPPSTTRSATEATVSPDLQIAAAQAQKKLQSERSAENLHAFGASQLLLGRFDAAVDALNEAATVGASRGPSALRAINTDLAAAYLARGRAQDRPDDFVHALNAADLAGRASSAPTPESLFNRALALEALHLRDQARAAWQDYLKRDSTSGWADEARRHLAALESQGNNWTEQRKLLDAALARGDRDAAAAVVHAAPTAVREYLEDELLPAWARQCRSGCDPEVSLRDAAFLARELAAGGDRLDADTVERLQKGIHDHAVIDGVDAYGRARAMDKASRIGDAAAAYREAVEQLSAAGVPLETSARGYQQGIVVRQGAFDAAAAALHALSAEATSRSYLVVDARSRWLLGLIAVTQGHYTAAAAEYRAALAGFERAGDMQNAANVHQLLAETLDLLGQPEQAWRERLLGLAVLEPSANPRRWNATLLAAALAAERDGAPQAGLAFETEAVASNERYGLQAATAEARVYRAANLFRAGDRRAARDETAAARRFIAQLPDAWLVSRLQAEADAVEGQILASESDRQGIVELTRAADYFASVKSMPRTAQLQLVLGRATAAAGQTDAAEAHYLHGLAAFEGMRNSVTNDEQRISFFDENWQLFDELVRLQLQRGRTDQAFEIAERGRARALLDAWKTDAPPAGTPQDLRRALPADTTVVCFYDLDKALLAWTIGPAEVSFTRTELSEPVRAALDRDPTGALSGPDGPSIFAAVWRPIVDRITTGRVAIVPSRRLQQLAFAALRDPSTGRYLVEDREIVSAPSAAMFLAASHRLQRGAHIERALVAGGSAGRRPDLPALAPLPAAAEELRAVGGQYPNLTELIGPAATREAFLAAISDQDVVHFAGHALISRRYPFMSRLVMPGAPDAAGRPDGPDLFASEIGRLRLTRTRLVVLSACSSGTGASAAGEGVLSLARPFIAAGVPTVVGSLWDVDDESTSALMRRFHEHYARTGDAGGSLRAAQVSLLRDADARLSTPSAWAAFTVVGGSAPLPVQSRRSE